MPSTDIDGSPVLIIGREQAEVIADSLMTVQLKYGLDDKQRELIRRLAATFPGLKLPIC